MQGIVFSLLSLTFLFTCISTQGFDVTFHLMEDQPNNTLIGSLEEETGLSKKINESLANLKFNLKKKEEPIISLFRLAESSQLFTNQVIDRENVKVCQYKIQCVFDFDVVVTSSASSYFGSIRVHVNVTDVNDHSPTFDPNLFQLNLPESTTANKSVYRVEPAQDLDKGGNNSVQSYQFIQVVPVPSISMDFRMEEIISSSEGLSRNIFTNVSLDYERQKSYVYHILARDGGNPQKTGTFTLEINVIDENDNSPIFVKSRANVTIGENTSINTPFYVFHASDKDSGNNGKIEFRFKKFQEQYQEIASLFSIENDTGTVRVIGNLKYEHGKVYHIVVEAIDKGDIPRYATAQLDVTVKDSGNNAPKININFLSSDLGNNTVSVSEEAILEQAIAVINVEDTDTGPNGEVTCRTYNTFFGLQSLNDGYKVIVQHYLDRETQSTHTIRITCADKGTPVLESVEQFTVNVLDANDNPPKFSEFYYNAKVDENNNRGKQIIQVQATDKDIGENGQISYFIDPPTDNRFSIGHDTGIVTANVDFDREQSVHITFTVRATDHGTPPQNTTANIWLDIEDVNDNPPNFLKANFVFSVNENLPENSFVGAVQAVDKDEGKNGEFIFAISEDYANKSAIPFTVSSSGEIKTYQPLDRELLNRYDFQVIAVDKGNPSLKGSAHVTVNINDKNDNAPIFIFPSTDNHTIIIPNTTPLESIIASIQAYDLDEDSNGYGNGKVLFYIDGGNEGDVFYLNHDTGSLHYRKPVGVAEDYTFHLKIRARDNGNEALEARRDLDIIVKYMNATAGPLHNQDDSDKNILIVVIVVCVTIVVSVALIAVICMLRRKNEDKMKEDGPPFLASRSPTSTLYDRPPAYQNVTQGDKSRPRVSFSKENDTFTKQQLMEKMTGHANGRIESGKYMSHSQQNPKSHTEESPSETSGETIPSDSGHGGSEEDFTSHNHNNNIDKRLPLQPTFLKNGVFVMQEAHSNQTNTLPNERRLNSVSSNMPVSKYMDDSLLTSSINSLWSDNNHTINRQNSNNVQKLPTIPAWTGYHTSDRMNDSLLFYSKDTTLGSHSAHSRDDDECTTTSGSYTINDDIDDSFDNRPRDMFV
ncbi:protocadherin alpha-1-like [Saccostrea echinata]|uniref:protocadherin alpha-1-like n=1 Tax=Saccostrea echinata TaxID=191078 RepID=UPI002A81A486|nr:protocadherin alpha-1-like [Saccostrea echinata]XP_061164092.1 protocadherin alpha-1-like [Saccostrea echinata]